MSFINKLLAHPLTAGLHPDAPQTTHLRRRIIKEKAFLQKLYTDWYTKILSCIPDKKVVSGTVVELGSGGGFLKEMLPEAIASDVFWCPHLSLVFDARMMPFASGSVRALVLIDVLHHIPDAGLFLKEAIRVLAPGGVVAMVEPWNTSFSRWIYQNLHPEPFRPQHRQDVAEDDGCSRWAFPASGPLSSANGAIPWIIFQRDKAIFNKEFPQLCVQKLELGYPFSYLLSGGVSMRALLPGCCFSLCRGIENNLPQFIINRTAMFSFITLVRK